MLVEILGIAAMALLIGAAAYLAASETALMRVSRIRVRYLVEKKERKAEKLQGMVEDPDSFLPSLLLMVLVVQMTAASLATWLATRLTNNAGIGVAVGTAVISAFMFVFGELVPKATASHNSERVALGVTGPISILSRLLRPLAMLFQKIAGGVLRLIGKGEIVKEGLVTEEGEIMALVSAAEEHDVIEEEERDMISSVFEFGDTMAREVMVPRPDMVTLPAEATVSDALLAVVEHGYSRIPVFEEDLDNIIGVLYAKDLLQYLRAGKTDEEVRGLAREAHFIPETKVLSDLLKDLQKRKVHMAIVIDEYGTVVGLVTIEDLLEEIVGEIFDEYDPEIDLVEKTGPNRFRVNARLNLEDLNDMLGLRIPEEEDVDSLGGLVLKVLGHVPEPGESFVYNGVAIKVEQIRNNRIARVMLELLQERTEEGHE